MIQRQKRALLPGNGRNLRGCEVLLDFQKKPGMKYGFCVTTGRVDALRNKVRAVAPAKVVEKGVQQQSGFNMTHVQLPVGQP